MNIFKRKDTTMDEPEEIGGTEAIRLRCWSRMRKGNLARTATDLQIPLAGLEAFARGERKLSVEQMHLMCKEFYPYFTKFNPETDKLEDIAPPAKVACAKVPEPYRHPDPDIAKAQAAYHAALRAAQPEPVRRPPTPEQEKAGRFPKRPGFA